MNSASDFPRTSSRDWVRTASVETQASKSRGRLPKGSSSIAIVATGNHDELVGSVDALVLKPVAGVAARQAAQRHQPRHEAQVGVRFAPAENVLCDDQRI